jgi:subtilisin family serine protease
MPRWTPRLGATLLATLALAAPAAADSGPDRVLVRFRASADGADRAAARDAVDGRLADRPGAVPNLQVLDLPPDASPAAAARALERRDDVVYAEPDSEMQPFRTLNDPLLGSQWALDNTGQTVVVPGVAGADVDAPQAWDVTLGDPSVVVADIDTGAGWDHPDLAPNVWTNPGETVNGVDDDGNGKVDDIRGWDFADDDNDPADFDGHGTGTASIIAARGDNGIGMAGVAPNARVMVLRAGSSTISVSAAVDAVGYAKAKGARIVNMSFGSAGESAALRDAIVNAPGMLFVAAAGNDGANVDTSPVFPCATNAPNIVCVGATTSSDGLASFSNRGTVNVDLAAPGQFIRNLTPALRRLFSDSFSTDIAGRWTTGGINNTWGRYQTSAGPPADFALGSNPPGTTYANSTNSTAQRVGTFDTSGVTVRECQASFSLSLGTAGPGDTVRAERASDGATFSLLPPAFTGTGSATKTVSLPLGISTLSFRFRFVSDASGVSTGAFLDDVSADCLKSVGNYDGTEFGFASGTSESAPLVAGAAALMLSVAPGLTPAALRQRLMDTAERLPALAGTSVTGGRLNVRRLLAGDTSQPSTAPPPVPATAPAATPTPLPPLIADTRAPGLTRLELTPVRFEVGRKAKLKFLLDEAAAVVVTFERRTTGRRSGGRCVTRTKKNKKAKTCGLWVAEKGSISKLVPAGKGALSFKGRLNDRALPAGTHRLRVRVADAAGNAARSAALSFLILAR